MSRGISLDINSRGMGTPESFIDNLLTRYTSLSLTGYAINKIPRNIGKLPSVKRIFMRDVNLHHEHKIAYRDNNRKSNLYFKDTCDDRSVEIFEPLIKSAVDELEFYECVLTKFPHTVFRVLNIEKIIIFNYTDGVDITGLCYCRLLHTLKITEENPDLIKEKFIIPKEIKFLTNLTHLSIKKCSMTKIPAEIGELTSLIELELIFTENQLKTDNILCDFSQLKNLKKLHLSGFYGYTLPLSIGFLNSLTRLNITHNKLKRFPYFVLNLPMLHSMSVESLGVSDAPPYLCGNKSNVYIDMGFEYYMDLNIKDYKIYWKLIYKIASMTGLPFGDLAKICDFRIDSPQFCKECYDE